MKLLNDISLKNYNTFSVDVKCADMYVVEKISDLPDLAAMQVFKNEFLVLGGGANVLFTRDFSGYIVLMENKGIKKLMEDDKSVTLSVAAGEDWRNFVKFCVDNLYYGLENLAGIPGKVGSSPVQNIGAYGSEVKSVIEKVYYFDVDSETFKSITNEECNFGYRDSIFKKELKSKAVIVEVVFKLSKVPAFNLSYTAIKEAVEKENMELTLSNLYELVIKIRDSKLPNVDEVGSAGSFFKNPIVSQSQYEKLLADFPNLIAYPYASEQVKLAAGQLIDMCGWKGVRQGDAGVYPKQALVLVNYGNATPDDILNLFRQIQQTVLDKFGVKIEPEVNFI